MSRWGCRSPEYYGIAKNSGKLKSRNNFISVLIWKFENKFYIFWAASKIICFSVFFRIFPIYIISVSCIRVSPYFSASLRSIIVQPQPRLGQWVILHPLSSCWSCVRVQMYWSQSISHLARRWFRTSSAPCNYSGKCLININYDFIWLNNTRVCIQSKHSQIICHKATINN